jgi:hypothetical protein
VRALGHGFEIVRSGGGPRSSPELGGVAGPWSPASSRRIPGSLRRRRLRFLRDLAARDRRRPRETRASEGGHGRRLDDAWPWTAGARGQRRDEHRPGDRTKTHRRRLSAVGAALSMPLKRAWIAGSTSPRRGCTPAQPTRGAGEGLRSAPGSGTWPARRTPPPRPAPPAVGQPAPDACFPTPFRGKVRRTWRFHAE